MRDNSINPEENTVAGHYKVVDKKSGGMGVLYICLDMLQDDFPVALKTYKPEFLSDRISRERFLREASIWIDLGFHPNIVQAYRTEYISDTHEVFIVMQLIPTPIGRKDASLRSEMKLHSPFSKERVLEIGLGVTLGMKYAVTKFPSLVHRDIKPENILIAEDGKPRITDFGLVSVLMNSRDAIDDSPFTNITPLTRGIIGSPLYMSPEQFQGKDLFACSDIYSLGCVLYEMLVGRFAVSGDTFPQLGYAHISGEAIKSLNQSGLSKKIMGLLEGFLYPSPDLRFQNWDQVKDALENAYLIVLNKKPIEDEYPFDVGVFQNVQKAESYLAIGSSYIDIGKYDVALKYYNSGLNIGMEINYLPVIASANANIGVANAESGNFIQAIDYYKKAINIWNNLNQIYWVSNNQGNLGNAYFGLMDLDNAQKYLGLALENSKKNNDQNSISRWLGNLGNVNSAKGNHEVALQYYKEALEISRQLGNKHDEYMNLQGVGQEHLFLGNDNEAIANLNMAQNISNELGDLKGSAVVSLSIGDFYAKNNQVSKALRYTKNTLDIAEDINDFNLLSRAYGNSGALYLIQGEIDKAESVLKKAISVSEEINAKDVYARANFSLGQVYEIQSKNRLAIKHIRIAVITFRDLNLPEYFLSSEYLLDLRGRLGLL